ncbi:MAG: YceD family protein [Campylobacterota bacterium]|nr:YceD family protein [Campylobacterota bacterium]
MKIVFDKIGSTAKPIGVISKGITLEGTLKKSGYHQVTLDAQMSGVLELGCDRCGDTYNYDIDNKLELKLSDLVSEDKDDLDIIEFLNGEIDLSYILESEITSIVSSYHYCAKCDNNDEDFEIEY